MVQLSVAVADGMPDLIVRSGPELDHALSDAALQSRLAGRLNIIILAAPNGDWLSLVVGGDETVVGFNHGHGDPPYYVSEGKAESDEPVLTAFAGLQHHTEFPRRYVVPMSVGSDAAFDFLATGQRPSRVRWLEL